MIKVSNYIYNKIRLKKNLDCISKIRYISALGFSICMVALCFPHKIVF